MENERKFKIFNFRPLLFIFLLSMCSAYFTYKCFSSLFYLFFFLLPIFFLIYVITKKRFILFAISSIILIFVSLYASIFIATYKDKSVVRLDVTLYGKIADVDSFSSKGRRIILSNCYFIDDDKNTKSLKGNVLATIFVDDEDYLLKMGSKVFFNCNITSLDILNEDNEVITYRLSNNLHYETTKAVDASNVFNLGDNRDLLEKFREYNKDLLISSYGESRGAIAYAMLYGEKEDVDENIMSSFRTTGVAHVFAVSGLHVGLIAVLLSYILRKLKVQEKVNFIVVFIFLFVFSALCSFSPSTLRASIMTLTFLFGRLLAKHYDPVNSLSFAGIILLILNPFNIFSYGFLLSFGAVFGILLLSPIFNKLKIENTWIRKIYSLLATTISAQVGILPIMMNFSALSTYSIIANIILIPAFSFFYNIFFIINVIILILPFLKFFYIIPRAFLEGIIFINFKISSLPYSSISVDNFNLTSIVFYYLALYCGGRLLVVKPSIKIFSSSVLLCISILFAIIYNFPYVPKDNKIVFHEDTSLCQTMLQTENGKIYLINPSMYYCQTLKKQLMRKNIHHIDGIILLRQEEYNLSFFLESMQYFSPVIYVGDNYYGQTLFNDYSVEKRVVTSSIIDETIKLEFKKLDDKVVACLISLRDKKLAFFSNNNIQNNYKHFLTSTFDFELNYARIYYGYNDAYDDLICDNIIIDVDKTLSFSL